MYWYHCPFGTAGLSKDDKRRATQLFKRPLTDSDRKTADSMIETAVDKFARNGIINFSDFNLILAVPSSSKTVSKTLKSIVKCVYPDTDVIYNAIDKTRVRNLKLVDEQLSSENSEKTKRLVPKCLFDVRRKHYDKVSKMHFVPTRFRRYFTNFFTWNKHFSTNEYQGRDVLIVDDTYGEGITFRDVLWMVERDLKPRSVCGFAVMRDM
jgi:hypothetical protein